MPYSSPTTISPTLKRRALQSRPDGSARTCIGCGKHDEPSKLARLVLMKGEAEGFGDVIGEGATRLFVNLPASLGEGARPAGRGARVHPTAGCLQTAERKGLSRAFRRDVKIGKGLLAFVLGKKAERLAMKQLEQAIREGSARAWPRSMSEGSVDPQSEETTSDAPLFVVARDAGLGPSGALDERAGQVLANAVAGGRAVVLSRSSQLRSLLGQADATIVAIRDRRLAHGIADACALASSVGFGGLEDG